MHADTKTTLAAVLGGILLALAGIAVLVWVIPTGVDEIRDRPAEDYRPRGSKVVGQVCFEQQEADGAWAPASVTDADGGLPVRGAPLIGEWYFQGSRYRLTGCAP